jgi:methylaspartate mutase epsilon subunit
MNENGTRKKRGHTIVLGGIGGDSHSVGLTILRQALLTNGYEVCYLGTQNRLEDFFQMASLSDVVMISSMDGHGSYYLHGFPEFLRQSNGNRPLWYLGGNLHLRDGIGYENHFLEMGFKRVFVKFIDVNSVLTILERDLAEVEPKGGGATLLSTKRSETLRLSAPVSDDLLEPDEFERIRRDALARWKTGAAAKNLAENAEFLARQASVCEKQALVQAGRLPILIQPRSGVALVPEQIKLFKAFEDVGAHVLSYQVDSLTRNNNYVGAERAIQESRASGVSTLNGFPVINHGVAGLRRIISEVKVPLQTRHSTRDPRLLAEISYAGGVTSFEGGAICYNIPYYKDYPLDESIRSWQYVDRLTGLYYERFGIKLDREYFGTLTATLIPPSLAIVINILQTLLAIRQGVKCFSLGYAEQGHRVQDIAAIRMLYRMPTEVLHNLGYKDVEVRTVFHQYMAAFPETLERAEELVYESAITAALSGATRVIVKTSAEAFKIPLLEDNVHAIALVRQGTKAAARQAIPETEVEEECAVIRREVRAILDSVIHCGRGSISEGIVTGFRKGFIDVPFSPSIHNRGEVMTARDVEGAVRFVSPGNLQLDRETLDFHRHKINERRRAEGLSSERQNYVLVEQDVMQIPRAQYERWPLHA